MSDKSRWYKWYPEVSCDLGSMPFEGSWTTNDRICQVAPDGVGMNTYYYNVISAEFGRVVTKKINGRMK